MTTSIFNAGSDAHTFQGKPTKAFGGPAQLALDSGTAHSYMQFPLGNRIPANATVTEARLVYHQAGDYTGANTHTVQRALSWKASKVTWDNELGVAGTAVTDAHTGSDNNDPWTFVVTADVVAWLAGTPNYGWRILTNSTTRQYIKGFDAASNKPTLEVDWSTTPGAPTDLKPSGVGAVSVSKPVMRWTAPGQSSYQVQIDAAGDFDTPDFDTGQLASTVAMLDLAGTAYAGNTTTAQWRVKVWNASGESPWSQAIEWPYAVHATVTITNPGATTADPTPPMTWTSAGQVARQVIVTNAAGEILNPNADWATTASLSYTPTKGAVADGDVITREVRTRDAIVREATDGAPDYAFDIQVTTFEFSATPDPILWLDVTQHPVLPLPVLRFDATEIPDGWAIMDDAVIVTTTDTGTELIDGTVYEYVDYTAAPWREHEYDVRRIVDNETSDTGSPIFFTPEADGVWLIDTDGGGSFSLGEVTHTLVYGEDSTIHMPADGGPGVKHTHALTGLQGPVSGLLTDHAGRTWQEQEADLWAIKDQPSVPFRFVMGDLNVPVVVSNLSPVVDPDALPGQWRERVGFEILQQDEPDGRSSLPFTGL